MPIFFGPLDGPVSLSSYKVQEGTKVRVISSRRFSLAVERRNGENGCRPPKLAGPKRAVRLKFHRKHQLERVPRDVGLVFRVCGPPMNVNNKGRKNINLTRMYGDLVTPLRPNC